MRNLELSILEAGMLRAIAEEMTHRGKILPKTPLRDRLKRRGLIFSKPPNEGYSRSVAGQSHRWRLTEAGLAALDTLT